MNKFVLLAALLLSGALGANAQTKGTNSLGLGVETYKSKYEGSFVSENEGANYSLRYAHFIKDNTKLGLQLSYSNVGNADDTENKNYGASFLYQKYFNVYKKLYVFVGGEAAYSRMKGTGFSYDGIANNEVRQSGNAYRLGAYGGASYFLGRHWELETRILSAAAGFSNVKNETNSYNSKTSAFALQTAGSFTNLGFSVNFLF